MPDIKYYKILPELITLKELLSSEYSTLINNPPILLEHQLPIIHEPTTELPAKIITEKTAAYLAARKKAIIKAQLHKNIDVRLTQYNLAKITNQIDKAISTIHYKEKRELGDPTSLPPKKPRQ